MYGLGLATGAQAQPGPLPQWCPGDFWDPVWGNNWDNVNCHDNWRGAGPNPHPGPGGPGLGAPGNPGGPGGPGQGGPTRTRGSGWARTGRPWWPALNRP